MLVKIRDESNYLKDDDSKAVININNKQLEEYKRLRQNAYTINENSSRVSAMEREIEMLKQIILNLQGSR